MTQQASVCSQHQDGFIAVGKIEDTELNILKIGLKPRRKTGWSLSSGAGISPAGGGALVAVPEAIAGGDVGGADWDLLSAGLLSGGLFSEFGFSDGRRNTGGASLSPRTGDASAV